MPHFNIGYIQKFTKNVDSLRIILGLRQHQVTEQSMPKTVHDDFDYSTVLFALVVNGVEYHFKILSNFLRVEKATEKESFVRLSKIADENELKLGEFIKTHTKALLDVYPAIEQAVNQVVLNVFNGSEYYDILRRSFNLELKKVKTGTAGIGSVKGSPGNLIVLYNIDFLTDKAIRNMALNWGGDCIEHLATVPIFIMEHEALHVMLGHLFGDIETDSTAKLAQEAHINAIISNKIYSVPNKSIAGGIGGFQTQKVWVNGPAVAIRLRSQFKVGDYRFIPSQDGFTLANNLLSLNMFCTSVLFNPSALTAKGVQTTAIARYIREILDAAGIRIPDVGQMVRIKSRNAVGMVTRLNLPSVEVMVPR